MTTQQAKQMWEAVLGELQLKVARPSYETWLKPTVGTDYRDGRFVVGTPNTFVAEMLEQRMYSLISQAMERVTKTQVEVRFEVMSADTALNGVGPNGGNGIAHQTAPKSEAHPSDLADGDQPSARSSPIPLSTHRPIHLNARYSFDSFIVGRSNELAHAAAMAVAEKPGLIYNPLVIYSDVGLGKTHLLHAAGHCVRSRGLSLIYATTEEFTNDYIKAIREGKTEEFRSRYRSTDVLLLDDIQFLIGKEQTQEGFFHTFNALHMANKQIVITSDRPVTSLTLLEDRIRSRLNGGLVVDIQSPDLETRQAILRAKVDQMRQPVDPEVVQFLSQRVHKNIRELEGIFNRIVAYAQFTHSPITPELVKRILADSLSPSLRRPPSPDAIIDAVAAYFQVDRHALQGPRGKKNIASARQVAMYLMREEAHLGPTHIGRALGGKDHSTVVKNCAKVSHLLDTDPHLRQDMINIRETLADR